MHRLIILAFVLTLAACTPQRYALTVLHTNDVHSHLLPFSAAGGTCRSGSECFGGIARQASAIKAARSSGENVLLLDAGDQSQGTLFYNRFHAAVSQKFMNELTYDAMTCGNHEFDHGPAVLAEFIRLARFPVLCANCESSGEPTLKDMFRPHVVLNRAGRAIGIFGITSEDGGFLSGGRGGVRFLPAREAARRSVAELRARGASIIIALTHIGLSEDKALASSVAGIDIIVGGHSHSILSNSSAEAEWPYPVVATSPAGEPVLIVSSGLWGKYLGELKAVFDGGGVVTSWQGDARLLGARVVEDQTVRADLESFVQELLPFFRKQVGYSRHGYPGTEKMCRSLQCPLGSLATQAMLWEFGRAGAEVALINSGAIRGSLPAGGISIGNVLEALPFNETLSIFTLSGLELRQTLEHAVSLTHDPSASGAGRFLQVAGVSFEYDPSRPAGERVVSATVLRAGKSAPLRPDQAYRVVSTSFLRAGGDDYRLIKEKAREARDDGRTLTEVVVDYMAVRGQRLETPRE